MNAHDARVAALFNKMDHDYDCITDLWYAWLFCRLHWLILREISKNWKSPSEQLVLDVGCGTGFQSFLYMALGAQVVGMDIAENLLAVAWKKLASHTHIEADDLFAAHYRFVESYNRKIRNYIHWWLPRRIGGSVVLHKASALNMPYKDNTFTHVNCCGSVLSLVGNHTRVLDEIARVLKPGGTFVIETEAKYNLDILWAILDSALLRGKLGFDCTLAEALAPVRTACRTHVSIEYPFGDVRDPVYMQITLFSRRGLSHELRLRGLIPTTWNSIHAVTNLIPSTVLDNSAPPRWIQMLFRCLSWFEEHVPLTLPGCSMFVFGRKAH